MSEKFHFRGLVYKYENEINRFQLCLQISQVITVYQEQLNLIFTETDDLNWFKNVLYKHQPLII